MVIEEILFPYFKKMGQNEDFLPDQRALIILDVLSGQVTTVVIDSFKNNDIEVLCIPSYMSYLVQSLDLRVNSYVKMFTNRKFNEQNLWQIMQQLDDGKELYDINILLELSLMKSLYAHWLLESYNQMGTIEGTDIILSVWTAFSIGDALKYGKFCLQPLDPFYDIQLTVESDENNVDLDLRAVFELTDSQLPIGCSPKTD